jgi:hypothetical protein
MKVYYGGTALRMSKQELKDLGQGKYGTYDPRPQDYYGRPVRVDKHGRPHRIR